MDDRIKKFFKTQVTIDFQAVRPFISQNIYEEVKDLWREAELGNDNDYYRYSVEDAEEDGVDNVQYPDLHQFIKDSGYPVVMLHWWW